MLGCNKKELGRITGGDSILIKRDRLIDPQRVNLYGYVRNNPLMFVDIDGKDLLIVAKTEDEANKKFKIYQKGFDTKDRSKVKLLVGNGKNGYKVGEFAVQIDAKAKGKDINFTAAQTLANGEKRATIAVVSPKENFQANFVNTDENGVKTTSIGEMNVIAKENFSGVTLVPVPIDGKLGNEVYSTTGNIEIYVASDQDDSGISETMHHEITAHGEPSVSGKPYGHSPRFSDDNVPKNDIDRKAIEAEKKAKKNFIKP